MLMQGDDLRFPEGLFTGKMWKSPADAKTAVAIIQDDCGKRLSQSQECATRCCS